MENHHFMAGYINYFYGNFRFLYVYQRVYVILRGAPRVQIFTRLVKRHEWSLHLFLGVIPALGRHDLTSSPI